MLGWARGGLIQQDWGSQAVEQNPSRGKELILGPVLCHWHKEGGIVLGWWLLGERSLPVPPEPALFPGHGTVCYGRDLIAGFLQGWRSTSARAWQWDLHFAPPSSEGSDSKEEPAVSTWFFPLVTASSPCSSCPSSPHQNLAAVLVAGSLCASQCTQLLPQ